MNIWGELIAQNNPSGLFAVFSGRYKNLAKHVVLMVFSSGFYSEFVAVGKKVVFYSNQRL
jgi:hypothetical protein